MYYYDLTWIIIGRIFAIIMFFGLGLYLFGSVCSFFKKPCCPRCGSRKKNNDIIAGEKPAKYCCGKCNEWYNKNPSLWETIIKEEAK